jgi:hypothetical protein
MSLSPEGSEAPVDVGTQAVPSTADPAPSQAESSASVELSEAEQHAQYLEVALKAADPKPEADSTFQPAPKATTPATLDPAQPVQTDAADQEDDGEDEGEDRGEAFGKHPRWQKMVAARNEYREKASAYSSEIEALRPKADEYGLIEQYMQNNGLAPDEVIDGFKIMALMKHDPAAAREQLLVHLNRLDTFLGHALPDDLQRQVDEGYVTEDLAHELASRRQQEQRLRQETLGYQKVLEQQQVQQTDTQQRQAMSAAVGQWEAQVKQRDPDYATKEPFVLDRLKVLRTQYRVQSPEQAVQLAQMAYDQASKQLRGLVRKPEVKANGAGQRTAASTAAKPDPRSFEEACLQAAGFTNG